MRAEVMKKFDGACFAMSEALRLMAEDNKRYDPGVMVPKQHKHRDFNGDGAALAILRALPIEAKRFLEHHLKNTIFSVNNYCELGMTRSAQEAIWQLEDVIEQILDPEVTHGDGAGVEAEGGAAVPACAAGPVGGEDHAAGA